MKQLALVKRFGKSEYRFSGFDGVSKRYVAKGTYVGVVRPDVSFGIYHDYFSVVSALFYCGKETPHVGFVLWNGNPAKHSYKMTDYGNENSVGIDYYISFLGEREHGRRKRVALVRSVVAVQEKSRFSVLSQLFSADYFFFVNDFVVKRNEWQSYEMVEYKAEEAKNRVARNERIVFAPFSAFYVACREIVVYRVFIVISYAHSVATSLFCAASEIFFSSTAERSIASIRRIASACEMLVKLFA